MAQRGESGYVRAAVAVTVGGIYIGGGVTGYTGGQSYTFYAKVRENDYSQQRQDTFDGDNGSYTTGIGGRRSRKMNLTMYYKGTGYPPDFEQYEVAVFQLQFGGGQVRTAVVILDSFKQTGDVDRALEYTVSGESDGVFV